MLHSIATWLPTGWSVRGWQDATSEEINTSPCMLDDCKGEYEEVGNACETKLTKYVAVFES